MQASQSYISRLCFKITTAKFAPDSSMQSEFLVLRRVSVKGRGSVLSGYVREEGEKGRNRKRLG